MNLKNISNEKLSTKTGLTYIGKKQIGYCPECNNNERMNMQEDGTENCNKCKTKYI